MFKKEYEESFKQIKYEHIWFSWFFSFEENYFITARDPYSDTLYNICSLIWKC